MTRRSSRVGLAASFLVVVTLLELGRQSGVPSWHSLWAEDGQIFLQGALDKSFLSTVASPYNGYMHLVPRLLAEVVSWFPLEDAAWLTALLASLLVGLVALFVFDASSVGLDHSATRVALALSLTLLPTEGFELSANLANLHWYLLFACFWAVVADATDRPRIALCALVALCASLSDPLAALFLPLALLVLVVRRSRRDLIVGATLLSGSVIQGVVAATAPSSGVFAAPVHVQDLPAIFGARVVGSLLIGDRFLDLAWRSVGSAFPYGLLAIAVVACVVIVRLLDTARRRLGIVSLTAAIAFFVAELAARGTTAVWPPAEHLALTESRYFFLPVLFLLTFVLVFVDARLVARSPAPWIVVAGAWLATIAILSYSLPNPRSSGPDWTTSLQAALARCGATGTRVVSISIAPSPGWSVRVNCPRK